MPQKKDDIEFLEAQWKKKIKQQRMLDDLSPSEFYAHKIQQTLDTDEERIARLADAYDIDGSLFRRLIPDDDYHYWMQKAHEVIQEQIDTIPRIIAKIDESKNSERDESAGPSDLIDLAKAITIVQISRTQIKRDIYAGKIRSYRKNPKGKHLVSEAEIKKSYFQK